MKTAIHRINKKQPSYEEVKEMVGGMVEVAYDDGNTQIICNEEGKLYGLPYNEEATKIWWDTLRKNKMYQHHNDVLVGDVVILEGKAVWKG